jgi:hypothetical protein
MGRALGLEIDNKEIKLAIRPIVFASLILLNLFSFAQRGFKFVGNYEADSTFYQNNAIGQIFYKKPILINDSLFLFGVSQTKNDLLIQNLESQELYRIILPRGIQDFYKVQNVNISSLYKVSDSEFQILLNQRFYFSLRVVNETFEISNYFDIESELNFFGSAAVIKDNKLYLYTSTKLLRCDRFKDSLLLYRIDINTKQSDLIWSNPLYDSYTRSTFYRSHWFDEKFYYINPVSAEITIVDLENGSSITKSLCSLISFPCEQELTKELYWEFKDSISSEFKRNILLTSGEVKMKSIIIFAQRYGSDSMILCAKRLADKKVNTYLVANISSDFPSIDTISCPPLVNEDRVLTESEMPVSFIGSWVEFLGNRVLLINSYSKVKLIPGISMKAYFEDYVKTNFSYKKNYKVGITELKLE